MSRQSIYLQLFLFAVLCLLITPAAGQETTGGIVGVVKDSSGSTVAGAKVSAVNAETDLESQTVSDENRRVSVSAVARGPIPADRDRARLPKTAAARRNCEYYRARAPGPDAAGRRR